MQYTAIHHTPVIAGTDYGPNGTGLSAWASGTTYAQGARVTYSGPVYASGTTYAAGASAVYKGSLYASLVGSNTGNTPESSPTYWSFVTQVNPTIYQSVAASTTGHEPDTSPTYWVSLGTTASPFYAVLCTTSNTGTESIKLNGDSYYVTYPAGSFLKGVVYYLSLQEQASSGATATFIGLGSVR